MPDLNTNKKLLILIIFCSLTVLAVGLFTELSLGDEAFHYRFAENIYKAGRRVAFDPLYGGGWPPGYLYITEPLWHTILALIWKLFGGIYFTVAQIYQTAYYSLLIFFTYLLGKELYGEKQGLYAALIIATTPVILAFSIVFYLDIPATALSVLCFWLIVKKKYSWAGITLGLMYLTKRNACFFMPAIIPLIIYQSREGLVKKAKSFFSFVISAFILIMPDILWREKNLKYQTNVIFNGNQIPVENFGTLKGVASRFSPKWWSHKTQEYLNSSFLNYADIVKYFGIILLIGLMLYFIFRLYKKRDLILWIPILTFYTFFCLIFHPGSDIRYLLPIVPLLAILASKAISGFLNKRFFKFLIILLCLLQFGCVLFFMKSKRVISPEIKQGFTYLRNNTPEGSLILYPENIIINTTGRRYGWQGNLRFLDIKDFFWGNDQQLIDFLKANGVSYIAVKKTRIYDDSIRHHYGGYPKSFVDRLPKLTYLNLVFDNKEISIWKVVN